MTEAHTGGILGSFRLESDFNAAIRRLRDAGFEIGEAFSPVQPKHLVEMLAPAPSRVRYLTLTGATLGLVGGFALALLSSGVWELVVDGKPVYNIVPFVVVGFELTILFGAIFNLAALLLFGRLPARPYLMHSYRPEFSKDRFGVWVTGPAERLDEAGALFREHGAVRVEPVTESSPVDGGSE
jgi:hypothetical protein